MANHQPGRFKTTFDDKGIDWFLSYVRGRRTMMLCGGLPLVAIGIAVIFVRHGGADLNIGMGAVVFLGTALVIGSFNGRGVLHDVRDTLSGTSRTMDFWTWKYASPGSRVDNRVMAALDDVGSTNRTPKIEFKAIWFTPGIAETSRCVARIYGGESVGQTVLAVGDYGGVMGRVKKVRPDLEV